jgi:hypothetical protein
MRQKQIKCQNFFTREKFVVDNPEWIDSDVFKAGEDYYRVVKEDGDSFLVIKLNMRFRMRVCDDCLEDEFPF